MIKQIILPVLLLIIGFKAVAQVGVQTDAPKATLDVTGKPGDPSSVDGIIPPKITKTQLTAKTGYGTAQTGAVVYVTDPSGPVNTATSNIKEAGLYIFDGMTWNDVNSGTDSTSGDEVTKIMTQGPVDPDQIVTSGIFEFRLNTSTVTSPPYRDYMILQIRVSPDFVMTGDIIAREYDTKVGVGALDDSDTQVITFTTTNRDQWRSIHTISTDGMAYLGLISVDVQNNVTSPLYYSLYAQRYGGNQGLPKQKTLIINKY